MSSFTSYRWTVEEKRLSVLHKLDKVYLVPTRQSMLVYLTYTEASSDGFNIAVHPAASAAATFHVAISIG